MEIFLSVGRTSTPEQEAFVSAVEALLRAHGLEPRTVGRTSFASSQPLLHVRELMRRCAGTAIVAFERSYVEKGIERRGSDAAAPLDGTRLPTVWNQIEAALAYSHGHPLLVIVEKGLKSEGLLEKGYDWFVQSVDIRERTLTTEEFQGVFADWAAKVRAAGSAAGALTQGVAGQAPAELTVGQLVKAMKPAHLWSVLGALATIIATTASLALRFGGGSTPVSPPFPGAPAGLAVEVQAAALERTGSVSPARCTFEHPCRGLGRGVMLKVRLTRPGYASVFLQDAGKFYNQAGGLVAANVIEGSSPLWPDTATPASPSVYQLWVVTSESGLPTYSDSTPLSELPTGTRGQRWGPVYLDTRP